MSTFDFFETFFFGIIDMHVNLNESCKVQVGNEPCKGENEPCKGVMGNENDKIMGFISEGLCASKVVCSLLQWSQFSFSSLPPCSFLSR